MLATITPISCPRLRPLPVVATGVDAGVDVGIDVDVDADENDDEAELEDKDRVGDDKDIEDEGVAEEGNDEVGVAGGVVMGVVVGGSSDVVGTGVEAGGVRPPYVQSEFNGI